MGLLNKFKKYGATDIKVGVWDKANNKFIMNPNKPEMIYDVVTKISKPFKYSEPYGSGGWVEGHEEKIGQNTYHFCYDINGTLKGFIHTYNVMFVDPNRHQLICIDSINEKFNLL